MRLNVARASARVPNPLQSQIRDTLPSILFFTEGEAIFVIALCAACALIAIEVYSMMPLLFLPASNVPLSQIRAVVEAGDATKFWERETS